MSEYADFTSRWEGFSETVYHDGRGNPTVGFGFNLARAGAGVALAALGDAPGLLALVEGEAALTEEQARRLLAADIAYAKGAAEAQFGPLAAHPTQVRLILVDLIYNMGGRAVSGFVGFSRAIRARQYALAALELVFRDLPGDVLTGWWQQTGRRARHHVSALGAVAKARSMET